MFALFSIRDAGTITAEFLGQLEATTQFLAALSAHADEWKRHMPVLFQYNELLLDLAVQVQSESGLRRTSWVLFLFAVLSLCVCAFFQQDSHTI